MEHESSNENTEYIKTSNRSNNEDIKFIKTLQSDNIKSISYSEIKNTKLIKIMHYGIIVKGLWRNHIVIMKHMSNELKNRDIEVLKQFVVENEPDSSDTRIADVGLYGSPSREINSMNYGVLPIIALEVLKGNEYSQASDIYSFWNLMWRLSTCIRPFCQFSHYSELALKICGGYRSEIVDNTPEVYSTLMKKCRDNDSLKRPKASELNGILGSWVTDICDNPDPFAEQFNSSEEKKLIELENNQFTMPEAHSLAIYNSEPIHFSVNYTSFIDWKQNLNKPSELPFR
ncbi:2549_t:CDS:2 [Gigaspora margarita]|uniref:2549_t:CDS:1 n=1 Tax=Gigaspora margarita TaxID=4874 RepID=A0ABN7VHQ0_GIGMA|nr:2549_t:CDS:2 [Gigaspora margarita]